MDRPLVAVVLAGGTGTRLYPASRPDHPKQLQALGRDRSLLAATVERAAFADETYVLTRPSLSDAVRDEVPDAAVLVEPEPKDTGPALVYAAHRIHEQVGDAVLCCLPSDHHVEGDFERTIRTAATVATETEGLVTVGVEPDRAATGYGYIRPGEAQNGFRRVTEFVEKPDETTAKRCVEAGYLWNAGMFAWTPTAVLEAARTSPLAPLVDALEAGEPNRGFDGVESISVDHAILERAEDVYVVPADFEWDDLGTWDALWRTAEKGADGTARVGATLALDTENCLLATDGHVSAVGVSDLAVVSFGDRTLVVPRGETERVREVVERLEADDLY